MFQVGVLIVFTCLMADYQAHCHRIYERNLIFPSVAVFNLFNNWPFQSDIKVCFLLCGWVASFSHLKARVNESNALLGWMIYYFVFWLLPMQVDRYGHDQFRCWLTFDMNMIIIIWLKWECDFNQICFKDYKLGLAKQEGKVILLFDSFE